MVVASSADRARPVVDDSDFLVELRAAYIPFLTGLACHTWFVIRRPEQCDRWEVWQRTAAGGLSFGHLHCNLMPPERGVGAGGSWVQRDWRGAEARALARRIESSPREYPFLARYRYWPGPNSNTYVQWVLADRWRLGWAAWGRGYRVPVATAATGPAP